MFTEPMICLCCCQLTDKECISHTFPGYCMHTYTLWLSLTDYGGVHLHMCLYIVQTETCAPLIC